VYFTRHTIEVIEVNGFEDLAREVSGH